MKILKLSKLNDEFFAEKSVFLTIYNIKRNRRF